MNQWIDPIFNMLKVKFDVLDNLSILTEQEQVYVFINLEDPFRYLVNQRNDVQLKATQYSTADIQLNLISNIINLGQHYRLYCKKHGKQSRVFLYWNYPKARYNNRKYWSKYRDDYDIRMGINANAEYITRCIEKMSPILNNMISFINQVYVINGGELESSLVPKIIQETYEQDMKRQCIIVSRSRYDYQYIQHGYTVIDPRGIDTSVLDTSNVIDHMKQKGHIKNPMTAPSSMLPFILSLLGDEHRGIPKVEGLGLSGIVRAINVALDRRIITDTTKDVDMLSMILKEGIRDRFKRNYQMTNLELQQRETTPVQINFTLSQILDKYDDRTLKEMNEKYFLRDPLMLIDTASEQSFRSTRVMSNPYAN